MSYPHRLPADAPILTLTREPQTPWLWTIELHNGEDNRLTDTLVNRALKPALDIVERDWRAAWRTGGGRPDAQEGRGALIIVGKKAQDKFFSNGLDYANSSKDANFFPVTFNPLLARLLTFPIPVIAAINGHCFAGGFMLALACDYRVMTDGKQRRAWACMNEVHFGAPWPHSFAGLANQKLRNPDVLRRVALLGQRFSPADALAAGIIDAVAPGGTTHDVLAAAEAIAKDASANARSGAWGLIKRDLYYDALEACKRDLRQVMPAIDDAAARSRL